MISFACPTCSKPFTVPGAYAGRTARCKACGAAFTVPAASEIASAGVALQPAHPGAAAPPPRVRRLLADAEQMRRAFDACEHIRVVSTAGDPPDTYEIEYRVRGLRPGPKDRPLDCPQHRVRITLPADYPRLSPHCAMLTPVFHPNINEATVCVGDHWTAGERLVDLVIRIAEMLGYQAYNIRSPLNGEAAMWADLNAGLLPTDPRPMRPANLE